MNEPRRWLDDPATSDQLRMALQGCPRPTEITPGALESLQAALEQATSALPNAAVVGTAAVTKAVALAVVVGVGGGVAGWWVTDSEAPSKASQGVATAVAAQVSRPERPKVLVVTRDPDVLARAEHAPATPHFGVSDRRSQLQQEAELIEVARKALATDPRLALAHTARHRERFRKPFLGFERDLVEMDALCRLGDVARATLIGQALVAAQPQSMYAERARSILSRARGGKPSPSVKDEPSPGIH